MRVDTMNDSKQATVTIVDFLKARVDEDEERLKFTTARGSWEAHRNYMTQQRGLVRHQPTEDTLAEFVYPADAEHAVYWQPSRVLAEITAKRAIIKLHGNGDGAHECPDGFMDGAETEPHTGWELVCMTQRHLAAIYSDHPDFRKEWAVGRGVEWTVKS